MDDLTTQIIAVVIGVGLGVVAAVLTPDKERDEILESKARLDHEFYKMLGLTTEDKSEECKMKDEYLLKIEHYVDGKKVWIDRAELYKDEYNSLIEYLEDNIHASDISAEEMIEEQKKRLTRCRDCVCLTEDDNKEWVCDEAGEQCAYIKYCPEGM